MNGQLRKATVKQFSTQLKEELHQFKRVAAPTVAGLGSVVFVWEVTGGLFVFLELMPSQKWLDESFMIEIGWNVTSEYPQAAIGLWNGGAPPPVTSPYGLVRLPTLYKDEWEANWEPWWCLGPGPTRLTKTEMTALRQENQGLSEEELRTAVRLALEKKRDRISLEDASVAARLADVDFKVNDALEKIKKYGLPYLKSVADAHRDPSCRRNRAATLIR